MSELFLKFLNISITAGWLVLGILVLRVLLKKAPKWINCIMWGIVALRLVFPFSIESIFSLIPSKETVSEEIFYAKYPTIQSGSTVVNNIVNPVISTLFEATPMYSINPIQIAIYIAANIWIAGMVVMAAYAVFSCLRLKKKMTEAVHLRENIWQSDYVDSAFVFGVFNPRIYVSTSLKEEQLEYVIAHESAHIARKDHWWKPIGFCLLAVYWFQPLIWVAYIVLCKDIEYACDERVIKDMPAEEKKAYSMALLECSSTRKIISACPVAFGEVNVERRVKTVLNYKKPAFWLSIAAVVICVALGVGFLTNPVTAKEADIDIPESNAGNTQNTAKAEETYEEEDTSETYIIESKMSYSVRQNYLTLLSGNQFIMEEEFGRNSLGGVSEYGTYERSNDQLTLQFSDGETYKLKINGDELIFEDVQTAEDFIIDTWNVTTTVESDRFVRLSTYTLLEEGWPEDFLAAMDTDTKDKLAKSGSGPASTYIEYYFHKDGTSECFVRRTKVGYQEPENIDDFVLKISLMEVPVGHVDFGEGYYEGVLDGVNVFCTYKWLQSPSTFGKEYKMRLTWNDRYFSMADNGFLKIDKYDVDGTEYIQSYEPGYAKGGTSEVEWYTDIKGAIGIEPDQLYGCAIVAFEKTQDVGALNVNFYVGYEVDGKTYGAIDEFCWKPQRVEVNME